MDKWQVHAGDCHPRLQEAFDVLMNAMVDTPPPTPLKMATLKHILKTCNPQAGQGPDHQVLKHWAQLPDEGLRCLLLVMNLMEKGSMPIQTLMVYVGLMPKAAGGERPIGLTSMPYRLLMKTKKVMLADWDAKFAGFWDDAIKGSPPLRAAIMRSLRVEVAKLLGFEAIGCLWYISAFFDSVDISLLIPLALERSFCPWLLSLAMKVHMGPRSFKEGRFISPWVEPSGLSILAGCMTSVSLTRTLLYDMLDEVLRSCRPVTLRTWVDDMFQLHTGPKEFVVQHALTTALRFAELVRSKRLTICGKSTITSSDQAISLQLKAGLDQHGVCLQVEDSAKD